MIYISKDDTNPKKIIKQNNEKNIRRQSLNLKKKKYKFSKKYWI